jgi:environmental stress-induced protein Ves
MTRARSRLLKPETYRAMPWRNGRGSTLEIARRPARGDRFAWRLSLADIERDGDFSPYPGYSRALVLVEGASLRLRFRGHGRSLLSPARRTARFEGEWQTYCTVPKGRCTDLSLIVRKSPAARPPSLVRAPVVLRLEGARRLVLAPHLYGAVFVLVGAIAIAESAGARPRPIRTRQTFLLSPGPRRILTLRSLSHAPAEIVVLRWRAGTTPAQRPRAATRLRSGLGNRRTISRSGKPARSANARKASADR